MTFDPAPYWRERGKVYERQFRPERYVEQERRLADIIGGVQFKTVLDVGCGFGRAGEIVLALNPRAVYTGIDISSDQLTAARRRLGPEVVLLVGDIRSLRIARRFDLVMAIEVLMHVPPADIAGVVAALRDRASHLVTVDWSRPISRNVTAPDFLHDYRGLLGPDATEYPLETAAQSIWVL